MEPVWNPEQVRLVQDQIVVLPTFSEEGQETEAHCEVFRGTRAEESVLESLVTNEPAKPSEQE